MSELKSIEQRLLERADQRLFDDVSRLLAPVHDFLSRHPPAFDMEGDVSEQTSRFDDAMKQRHELLERLHGEMIKAATAPYRDAELAAFVDDGRAVRPRAPSRPPAQRSSLPPEE